MTVITSTPPIPEVRPVESKVTSIADANSGPLFLIAQSLNLATAGVSAFCVTAAWPATPRTETFASATWMSASRIKPSRSAAYPLPFARPGSFAAASASTACIASSRVLSVLRRPTRT